MSKGPAGRPLPPDADLRTLFHHSCRALRRNWADQLEPWGVTPFQWRALHRLWDNGGSLRPGELATQLRMAPRSATEVVDQLEERRLIERIPDPNDRRARLARLLPKGEETVCAILELRTKSAQEFFARLTMEEQDQLTSLLGKLLER